MTEHEGIKTLFYLPVQGPSKPDLRFYSGLLPVVGVGDFSTSAALPNNFALRRQRLEAVLQLEPVVLANRI